MFNKEKYQQAVKNAGYRENYISKTLGISPATYCNKKNGASKFKISEVYMLKDLLSLSEVDTKEIFFGQ